MIRLDNHRSSARIAILAMTACASATLGTDCGIYLFEVDKNVSYTQTSNLAPTEPDAWYFHAGIFYDIPGAVTDASMSFNVPPPFIIDLFEAGTSSHQYYSAFYLTRGEMDAAYPSTMYTMTVDCGAGGGSAGVFLPADLFCAEVPHFTGDTFDRLQSYDPSLEFSVDVNGFTVHPGANVGALAVAVSQDMVGGVFSLTLEPGQTRFEIPAGTLAPGVAHSISISYVCILHTPDAGFGGASSDAAFSRGTSINFVTLPGTPACIADFDDGSGTGTPDGGVTIEDLLYYLTIFDTGDIAADVDDGSFSGTRDGGVTIDDLLYFLFRFDAGC